MSSNKDLPLNIPGSKESSSESSGIDIIDSILFSDFIGSSDLPDVRESSLDIIVCANDSHSKISGNSSPEISPDNDIIFSKILSLTESSLGNSENDVKVSTHTIYHCHTTLNCNVTEYTWKIGNFWTMFNSLCDVVTYETGNQPFNIKAYFDKKNVTVTFSSLLSPTQKGLRINYTSHIQTTNGPQIMLNYKNTYVTHNSFIHSIDFKDISVDEITSYTPNNTLTVYFKFEVLEILHNIIYENILPSHRSMLNTFVLNKSDLLVKFVVEKQFLSINKNLLCSKSEVFEAIINRKLKGNTNNVRLTIEIQISDITYNVLKHLLFYIETDSLVLDDLKMNADTVTHMLYSLIAAANKYNIKGLLLLCEQLLIQNASENNIVEHLRVAQTHNAKLLKNYATKFIKLYEDSIVKTADFETLMKEYPHLLIKMQKIELNTEKIICDK